MLDCNAILAHSAGLSEAITTACIAKSASIEAAVIQAHATAASSQWTLVGAGIAFFSALYAARAPGNRERRERARLAHAYRYRMFWVVASVAGDVTRRQDQISRRLSALEAGQSGDAVSALPIIKPDEIETDKWKDHTLLTRPELEVIMELDRDFPDPAIITAWMERINSDSLPLARASAALFAVFAQASLRAESVMRRYYLDAQMEFDWDAERRRMKDLVLQSVGTVVDRMSAAAQHLRSIFSTTSSK